jgi:hypothetical protein
MCDPRIDGIEVVSSGESTSLQLANPEIGESLPEPVIQALEDVLVNCCTPRFDPATGMFTTSDDRRQVASTGDNQRSKTT